jgi:uncharacterized protein YndB with AHSA1/START domain
MAGRKLEVFAEPGKPTIVMRRSFDAPRRLVFEAMTKPEHLARWWGPRGYELVVCDVDLRVGGAYRFVQRTPDGREFAFRGVYREISPARTVSTFVFEGMPDHEAVITIELEERDGKTIMTETMVHDSVAARDGHLASGMERGANESMERLEEVLAGMGAAGAADRRAAAG